MSTVPKPDRADKAQELRQRIDASIDTLAKAVDSVRASETFTAYLRVQARFHKYSWGNAMLILSQRPEASRVAGHQTWKSLKRQVRKGERGIMIFAPCPFKRDKPGASGEIEEGIFFRAVHVFDVAQTDGPDLPTVDVPTVDTAADDLLARLVRVAEHRSVTVKLQPIDGGAFGVSKRGTVEVDNRHATGQQAKTLAHEITTAATRPPGIGHLGRDPAPRSARRCCQRSSHAGTNRGKRGRFA